MRLAAALTAIFLLIAAGKEAPITVKVSPPICFAPCSAYVTLTIPQQADNRYAVVEIAGEEYHSSWIQLDGEQAPRTFRVPMKGFFLIQSAGEYEVKGILFNTTKEYARQRVTLIVKGNEP